MPKFAANLTMMFTEWPFLDRFAAAADAGFQAVEYLFPYEYSPEAIALRLQRHALTQALFNMPPGDWEAGERGLAALPDRFEDVMEGVARALRYAEATGVKRLHLMAGNADPGTSEAQAAYRRAVTHAAAALAAHQIDLLLEPINARNMPGYFLNDFGYAETLIADLALPNLRLQFDIYHRQIIHGDIAMALNRLLPITGHIQIAGVPSRHEPDTGEVNYPYLFKMLDEMRYDGFIGCEYNPKAGTRAGLGWFRGYGAAP
jgi:hydroxypyruvate isomerase